MPKLLPAVICLLAPTSVLHGRPADAQSTPHRRLATLAVQKVLYSSPGVVGVVGATVTPAGVAYLVLRSGELVAVDSAGAVRHVTALDTASLFGADPVPMAATDLGVALCLVGTRTVLWVSLSDGSVAARTLPASVTRVVGIGFSGQRLVVSGFDARAPDRVLHEYLWPSLVYAGSFGAARQYSSLDDRQGLTGGTVNAGPSGELLFGELNPPRLEVFSERRVRAVVCTPDRRFEPAESVAAQDSAGHRVFSNAFPKSRGAARLDNGLYVFSAFDIRHRTTYLLFFDSRCVTIREGSLAADLWIVGTDRSGNLYVVRTYGDQDLVGYRLDH